MNKMYLSNNIDVKTIIYDNGYYYLLKISSEWAKVSVFDGEKIVDQYTVEDGVNTDTLTTGKHYAKSMAYIKLISNYDYVNTIPPYCPE